jgi:hypothetical protein
MKKKSIRKLIIPMVVIIIVGIATLCYVFRGAENSVKNEKAVYSLTSDQLFTAFDENEATANDKFLGKVIEVTGMVTGIEKTDKGQLILLLSCNSPMGGIRCTFETNQDNVSKKVTTGSSHMVKGKCSGMLMEVVLDNCSLSK